MGQMTQPLQQCQSTEGSSSHKDRLQSHQVHLTMLQYTCIQYTIYLLKFEASVRLCAPWSQKALTLYPATDCAAATDISAVSGRWQLSR